MRYKLLISGPPGVGKTYIARKIAEEFSLPGIITLEVRERGIRTGFLALDLRTGEKKPLASVEPPGIKYGKYFVNPATPEWMVERVLEYSKTGPTVLDEIGPMELISENFRENVHFLLSERPIIATIHRKLAQEYSKNYSVPLIFMNRREDQKKVMEFVRQLLF